MLVTEKQPFKGMQNYFTNALLYREAYKVRSEPEDSDSGNKEDVEPEPEGEGVWELNLSALEGLNELKAKEEGTCELD